MAKTKVTNITKIRPNTDSSFFSLSETPNSYDPKNYYVKVMQDKVNAEWECRPNRIDVLYENTWGSNVYDPLEVVVQHVKNDAGTQISSDHLRLVFKDINEDRFLIGHKFLFNPLLKKQENPGHYIKAYYDEHEGRWTFLIAETGDPEGTIIEHHVDYFGREKETIQPSEIEPWLVVNIDSANLTSSIVVQRCNSTIGSVYIDEFQRKHAHYEPVILTRDLSAASFIYNQTAVNPQSGLLLIAQHNQYTEKYFTNQRFIIGSNEVYRIKAINKFYGNTAFNPYSNGLMTIYLEITDASPYDDLEKRLAYQKDGARMPETDVDDKIVTPSSEGEQSQSDDIKKETFLSFKEPNPLPNTLGIAEIKFVPQLVQDNQPIPVKELDVNLKLGDVANVEDYVELKVNEKDLSFTLKKKRTYLRSKLEVECQVKVDDVLITKTLILSLAGI